MDCSSDKTPLLWLVFGTVGHLVAILFYVRQKTPKSSHNTPFCGSGHTDVATQNPIATQKRHQNLWTKVASGPRFVGPSALSRQNSQDGLNPFNNLLNTMCFDNSPVSPGFRLMSAQNIVYHVVGWNRYVACMSDILTYISSVLGNVCQIMLYIVEEFWFHCFCESCRCAYFISLRFMKLFYGHKVTFCLCDWTVPVVNYFEETHYLFWIHNIWT